MARVDNAEREAGSATGPRVARAEPPAGRRSKRLRRLLRLARTTLGIAAAAMSVLAPPPAAADGGIAVVADLKGAIGPATQRFVDSVLERAAARDARIVVLRIDTPGGLSSSMREIIQSILRSPVPVASYVSPSGARAASAGTYILYASHVAAMAPGTNLGAATPVQIGGGLPLPGGGKPGDRGEGPGKGNGDGDASEPAPSGDAMEKKAVNDAVAYIRSLAELRGRDAEWAEQAVREAASLSASAAAGRGVVDFVAADLGELLARTNGRSVDVGGDTVTLDTEGLAIETVEPSWQTELLTILTNPNVAFVLMLIGIYGLVFEFANPGSIGPGVVGVICLLLAMYALNMLPLDWAGLGLLVVGIAFMVAETVTPTFGVLGIGGLVAFVIGATILFDSESPAFRLSVEVIAVTAIASAALLVLVLGFALRAQRRSVTTGDVEVLGAPATVLEWQGREGYVHVRGERWHARGDESIEPGTRVSVERIDGLTLDVAPRPSAETGESE